MVQTIVNLGEYQNRILTIVKGKFGFKNKSDAVNYVIDKYEKEFLEPQLKPEYIEKIKKLDEKGKFHSFNSLSSLRKKIENA